MDYYLMHRDDPCLPLLEAGIDAIRQQVHGLVGWFRQPHRPRMPMALPETQPTFDAIKLQISQILTTSWRREDLITILEALGRIRRSVDVLGHRLAALEEHLDDLNLAPPIASVEKAVGMITQLVKEMRDVRDPQHFKALMDGLTEVHSAMEKALNDAVRTTGPCSSAPLQAIVGQELAKAFDDTVEHCEQAGNQVYKLVLSCH